MKMNDLKAIQSNTFNLLKIGRSTIAATPSTGKKTIKKVD